MDMFSYIVIGTLLLVPLVWIRSLWSDEKKRKEFAERNVKYVKFPNIFFSSIRKERQELLRETMVANEGKIFGFEQFFAHTIFVAVPELIQVILSKEFTNFADRRSIDVDDKIFSNAINAVNGEQWKRLRSIITPAFSAGKLRRMQSVFRTTLQTMLTNLEQTIEKSEIIEVKQLYSAFTMDTIVQSSFGIKIDSFVDKDNQLVARARKLFAQDMSMKDLLRFTFIFVMPKVAKMLGFQISDSETDYFRDIVIEIIKKKRKEMNSSGTEQQHKANNFIELLLEAEKEAVDIENNEKGKQDTVTKTKTNKYITNDELVAQAVIFFMVGFETTASTITFVSYLLALHPDKQEKLYEDIVNTLKELANQTNENVDDPIELVTSDSLSKFKYLTAVVNETLRLYSPAPLTDRVALNDVVIQTDDGSTKINVKKGDVIEIPIYSMQRDPEQFPNPELFQPERFLDETPKTFHKYAFIPFGSGPRNCVAQSFALIEVKHAILHTVLHYKLGICNKTTIPVELYYQSSFVTPKNVYVKMEKR